MSPSVDRMLGLLLLAPGILLALPGPLAALWFDPFPRLAGAGLAALAAAPVALLLLWRPRALRRARDIRGPFLLALLLYEGLAAAAFGYPTDTFEARRALTLAAASLVLLGGAGHLGREGRRWFLGGVMVLSGVWTGFALGHWIFTDAGHLEGVLGNSGPLSQAALPGAAVGAWLVMRRRGAWLVAGLVPLVLFVAHALAASVNAALVSILAVLLVGAWRARRDEAGTGRRGRPWVLAGLLLVAAVGVRISGKLGGAPAARAEPNVVLSTPIGGGAEVRLRIWRRLPALVASAPLLGTGPGQFLAAFPPFRDPREAVLSRGGPCSELSTEVEHPHNDWLLGVVQNGLLGGVLWLAFLLLALRACLRAVRRADDELSLAGAAGGAVLVNALFHAPLLVSPASAVLAFPLFGLLLEEDGRDAPPFNRMLLARVTGALGLFAAWVALPLVLHGQAMADYVRAARRIATLTAEASPGDEDALRRASEDARKAAARAVRAAPHSVPAALLRIRLTEDRDVLGLLDEILARRPHSFEVLEQKAVRLARAERFDEARAAWETALALDPTHPRILRGLIRLEMTTGRAERGKELLDRLRAGGCLEPAWLETLGTELLLTGRAATGAAVLAELDERLRDPGPSLAYALSREAKQKGHARRADALRTLAHLLWAREQVAAGDLDTAVRSYRQALASTRRAGLEAGAPALRLEMAAAEWLAGRADEARRTLEGLSPAPADRAVLPPWAREVLAESGTPFGEARVH